MLLEIQMLRFDGFGVCRKIKSVPETRLIPVVMVTALGQVLPSGRLDGRVGLKQKHKSGFLERLNLNE